MFVTTAKGNISESTGCKVRLTESREERSGHTFRQEIRSRVVRGVCFKIRRFDVMTRDLFKLVDVS